MPFARWLLTIAFALTPVIGEAAVITACDKVAVASWLIGNWSTERNGNVVRESWKKSGADAYEGSGSTTSKDGTVVDSESLHLAAMSGRLFYIVRIARSPLPVPFELTECDARHLVFENATHDFPKRLEYTRGNSAGAMTVQVGDGRGGGYTLDFKRAKAGR